MKWVIAGTICSLGLAYTTCEIYKNIPQDWKFIVSFLGGAITALVFEAIQDVFR